MSRIPYQPRRRAFTLIELMVSIALVLILILGINQVFKIASDTVNAGQALSGADRENRGIQGTMYPDVQNMVLTNAPYFIIRSRIQPAFRSRADEQDDRDGNPMTQDIDGDNKEGGSIAGETTPATVYNSRNHRLDKLHFFANYLYRRQTGSGGQLITDFASNEAYIVYGHLDQPGADTAVGAPRFQAGDGATANTNNRYANQWILGRNVILLSENAGGASASGAWTGGEFIRSTTSGGSPNQSPLALNSRSADGRELQEGRYDLAQTSIGAYRNKIYPFSDSTSTFNWWDPVSQYRFLGYPFPTRPLNGDSMARTAPIFVRSCSQFIVEYAGDYLTQGGANGDIVPAQSAFSTPPVTDGVIDYVQFGTGPGAYRKTRWYGLPRNYDASDDLPGKPMIRGASQAARMMVDVVPLRDVLVSAGITPPLDFFERDMARRVKNSPNYADLRAAPGLAGGGRGFVSPIAGTDTTEYCAAWGPDQLTRESRMKPKLLRVTVVIDDPAGRMGEGQTYEYVFNLP